MTFDKRVATRYVFESRILIRLGRGSQRLAVNGWARDLSESGLGGFVAQQLILGEAVSLEIPLPGSKASHAGDRDS